ncbi:glycerophosphodiester phosphodiesterase [Exilibacterium tricleocarpae]|uniref:glycerophosphodiester phosphodiesterase n=1 Tax=Exilibacterium tricleocarpae TaxID=2591008 RepID=A0A545TZ15_9GAMM|nr:glycerophosphodiester phosphodiesterase [Exilibacterium tricleocarpae]TQV82451.1 glycerophosphodiester phosphodiesterase [Exilibacterium tricleocarpae]
MRRFTVKHGASCLLLLLLGLACTFAATAADKLVIAHRGASGYLPEHTLAAKALAYGMGAHYIEQDIVLTKDDVPVVLHDIYLDAVTDVKDRFPDRARGDGRFYALDFTLAEIRQLRVNERIDLETGARVYPQRFAGAKAPFRVPTLAEEIELILGLNRAAGKEVGIYPEIKKPAWHRRQGRDISKVVLQVLSRYGYRDKNSAIYLQCFDAGELKRIRRELGSQLRLVQLLIDPRYKDPDNQTDFQHLLSAAGLREVAAYADGIGPWLPQVVSGVDASGKPIITDLVKRAQALRLVVHPYTFRADQLPQQVASFEQLLGIFFDSAGVDGVFTDFPDRAVAFLQR